VERIAARLLAEFESAAGPVDLMATLAYPLPLMVIAELLGLPLDDHSMVRRRVSEVIVPLANPAAGPELKARGDEAAAWFQGYFTAVAADRRRRPGQDLLSTLCAPNLTGDQLTPDEIVSTCLMLIIAAFETTATLIGNGLRALLAHPDQIALLRRHPELLARAPDECLRYYSSPQFNPRLARTDVTLSGVTIPGGATVIALQGSANRDEEVFPRADRLDLERHNHRAHIGFGRGITYCLGAPLARIEATVAFRALLDRFPSCRIDRCIMSDTLGFWGPKELHVNTST
jgi:hypothetical protein